MRGLRAFWFWLVSVLRPLDTSEAVSGGLLAYALKANGYKPGLLVDPQSILPSWARPKTLQPWERR